MTAEDIDALVIGSGPAGLMAAEQLAGSGLGVIVAEAKPSPARKFLMAGKSGLNITRDESPPEFASAFSAPWLSSILGAFGPPDVKAWAEGLGQPVFTGSSGRVFPVSMKASPLLRAWLRRLDGAGVRLRTRWRWSGWDSSDEGNVFEFETPDGHHRVRARVAVLALGGASWARLGSDAAWVPWLAARGVAIAPFRPANMGFRVDWSAHMHRWFGRPVKAVALTAGRQVVRGEFVISARGIEGGGVYAVAAAVRDGAGLALDLAPDLEEAEVADRLVRGRPGETTANLLRRVLGLGGEKVALLQEWGRPLPTGRALARLVKALPVRHAGPRPIDEAISVAGGVERESLTDDLELKQIPGVFCAGEMLDWEAPTGGYLLTACLATGRWAGRSAVRKATS